MPLWHFSDSGAIYKCRDLLSHSMRDMRYDISHLDCWLILMLLISLLIQYIPMFWCIVKNKQNTGTGTHWMMVFE